MAMDIAVVFATLSGVLWGTGAVVVYGLRAAGFKVDLDKVEVDL